LVTAAQMGVAVETELVETGVVETVAEVPQGPLEPVMGKGLAE
jgi:hypothetical protein